MPFIPAYLLISEEFDIRFKRMVKLQHVHNIYFAGIFQ